MNNYIADIDKNNRATILIDINSKNGRTHEEIEFKVDSGADRTSITLEDLETLGYTTEDVKSLIKRDGIGSGAYGNTANWFSIDLKVNHIMRQVIPKGTKFPFLCITEKNVPKPQNCATGCELTGKITGEFRSSLLGNDILSCFEWITDHKNRKMIFTKIEDIKARNKQYPDCEMLAYEVARNYPLNQKAEEALRLIRNSDFILKTIDNDNRAIITLESDIIKTGLHELLGAGLIKMSSRVEKDGKIFIQYEEVK